MSNVEKWTIEDYERYIKILKEGNIQVGIYYYIDDDGKKVYDTEEMTREFEEKLKQLTNE